METIDERKNLLQVKGGNNVGEINSFKFKLKGKDKTYTYLLSFMSMSKIIQKTKIKKINSKTKRRNQYVKILIFE